MWSLSIDWLKGAKDFCVKKMLNNNVLYLLQTMGDWRGVSVRLLLEVLLLLCPPGCGESVCLGSEAKQEITMIIRERIDFIKTIKAVIHSNHNWSGHNFTAQLDQNRHSTANNLPVPSTDPAQSSQAQLVSSSLREPHFRWVPLEPQRAQRRI